jgi:hypothetical protein
LDFGFQISDFGLAETVNFEQNREKIKAAQVLKTRPALVFPLRKRINFLSFRLSFRQKPVC